MYCPKCGKEISNEVKFCPKCGEKTERNSNAITDKEKESQQTNSVAKGVLLAVAAIFALWLIISGLIDFSRALG